MSNEQVHNDYWWLVFYSHINAHGRLNGPSDLQRLWSEVKDEAPSIYAHAEIRTRVVVICDPTRYHYTTPTSVQVQLLLLLLTELSFGLYILYLGTGQMLYSVQRCSGDAGNLTTFGVRLMTHYTYSTNVRCTLWCCQMSRHLAHTISRRLQTHTRLISNREPHAL